MDKIVKQVSEKPTEMNRAHFCAGNTAECWDSSPLLSSVDQSLG